MALPAKYHHHDYNAEGDCQRGYCCGRDEDAHEVMASSYAPAGPPKSGRRTGEAARRQSEAAGRRAYDERFH